MWWQPVVGLKATSPAALHLRRRQRHGSGVGAYAGACMYCHTTHAAKQVEVKTTAETPDTGNLQRAADFIHAYILGFEVQVGANRQQGVGGGRSGLLLNADRQELRQPVLLSRGMWPPRTLPLLQVRQHGAYAWASCLNSPLEHPVPRPYHWHRTPLRCCVWTTCTLSALRSRM